MKEIAVSLNLIDLVNDPIKISIWQEIFNNEGITAKELKKRLVLEGTSIYYHLNYLEENKLILSETHMIPNSNLSQKTYRINKELYSLNEKTKRKEIADSFDRAKDILLLKTHMIISHFQQQVRILSKTTNEEIKKLIEKDSIFINDIIYVQDKDLLEIVDKVNEVKSIMNRIRKSIHPEEYSKNATNIIVFSTLPLKDI